MKTRLLVFLLAFWGVSAATYAQSGSLTGSTPLVSNVPIVSTATSGGNVTFNCGNQPCGLSVGQQFLLAGNSNASCNGGWYTVSSVAGNTVTAAASTCSGSGSGGKFANISPALTASNAANPSSGLTISMDPDGTAYLQVFGGGALASGITLDTTPRASIYVATGGGVAADEYANTCVATGAVSNPTHQCNDPHVWVWNNDGHLAKARGGAICTNGATGNCVDLVQEYATFDAPTLSTDISDYTVYTTVAGSGPNDLETPGAAGLYEFTYWLKALGPSTQLTTTMTVSISCVDELGGRITVSSQPFPFSTAGNVAQGSLFCYSEANQPIQVSYTHTGGLQPSYHANVSLWKR